MFRVHTGALKALLTAKADNIVSALVQCVKDACLAEAAAVSASYNDLVDRVAVKPKNEPELLSQQAFLGSEVPSLAASLDAATANIHIAMASLAQFNAVPSEAETNTLWSVKEWPQRLQEVSDSQIVHECACMRIHPHDADGLIMMIVMIMNSSMYVISGYAHAYELMSRP